MHSIDTSVKSLGNFFVHLPPSMHGELGLATPQGPCIMNFVTIGYNSGNMALEFLHKLQNHTQLLSWACLHYHISLVYGHEEVLTSATQ